MEKEKFKTNIPRLDEMLSGGLSKGTITFLHAQPGVEHTPFGYHILAELINKGFTGICFLNNKRSDTAKKMMEDWGHKLGSVEKNNQLLFVDGYSSGVGMPTDDIFSVKDTQDPDSISKAIMDAMKSAKNKDIAVLIDSLSTMFDVLGEDKGTIILKNLKKFLEKTKSVAVILFTEWPYDKKKINTVMKLADNVISLRAVEEKIILRQYFIVTKSREEGPTREIPYRVLSPGGIRVYIPKILVTGPFNAGKSSFVHSVSTKAVSVDRLGTTVALDHGHIDHRGFSADVFGTPGQSRFDPILKHLGGEALAVILVIDSTAPETFVRAKEMLETTTLSGLPYVVVANKADMKMALKSEEIRKKMTLPKQIPIIPVKAKDLKNIREGTPCELNENDLDKVLDVLFERIFKLS